MAKNTIFIVIDSLYYDRTIETDTHHATMPFLDELRKKGIDCVNMYSEAPYTEAALVSLLCGIDTMKKGGYLLKLKKKETIMETFKNNGYETFCNCIQPLVYPKYSYPGVSDGYYNICYDFDTLWDYRLSFYQKKYLGGELDEKTVLLIQELLDDNFKTWEDFFKKLKSKDKLVSFILPYIDTTNLDDNLSLVSYEYKQFKKDKTKYVEELLTEGKNHSVFKIHTYNLSLKMSEEDMRKLYYKYRKIITKMLFKNFKYNLLNNRLFLKPFSEWKGLLKAYFNAIYNRFLFQKINYHIKSKKAAPSMYTTFKHFESWLLSRKNDKPYFAYLHLDDCHSKEMFYTYDTSDFNLLDYEFNNILNYLNNLPRNYCGSISYDVSLNYADNCLKQLYTFLEDNHMLDDVTIAICADHGSSYSFCPYRSNYVNNVHRENYNMPFVIWNKDIKHVKDEGYHNTKDIPATLLDINNIQIPKDYDGKSILNDKGRDYVLLENVNGGCPDYNYRDILLGVRNKRFLVVMEFDIHKSVNEGQLHSVYDLLCDKGEKYNLKDTIDKITITHELNILKDEFIKLKADIDENNYLKR